MIHYSNFCYVIYLDEKRPRIKRIKHAGGKWCNIWSQVGKEEWRGMHGLEKKYNLVIGFPDKMFMFLFFPRISLYFCNNFNSGCWFVWCSDSRKSQQSSWAKGNFELGEIFVDAFRIFRLRKQLCILALQPCELWLVSLIWNVVRAWWSTSGLILLETATTILMSTA